MFISGNCSIPVANCSRKQFNSHEKTQMIFKEFLEYWKKAMENEGQPKTFTKKIDFTVEIFNYPHTCDNFILYHNHYHYHYLHQNHCHQQ